MQLAQKILGCVLAFHLLTAFANTSTVYFNGDILTMQGESPQYVEAIVVQNDKIMFAGDKGQALTLVRVGDRVVLLGQSAQGFTRLAEFAADSSDSVNAIAEHASRDHCAIDSRRRVG